MARKTHVVSAEEQFEEIGSRLLSEAAMVKCPIPDYIEGLELIQGMIEASIQAAQDDLKRQEKDSE